MTTNVRETLRIQMQDADARALAQTVLDAVGFWDILAERDALRADRHTLCEALRQVLCTLPKYSFLSPPGGGVRRVQDRSGRWIEFDAVHKLFDPAVFDALATKNQRGEHTTLAMKEA